MLTSLMTLDRRAQYQAVVFSALAQVLGLAAATVLTSGAPSPANVGQVALAAVYTVLSTGMALHVAARLQAARQSLSR